MVSLIKKLYSYREYITLIAYGIVIGDVLELLKEVATEYLMHKRFNQLVQRHVEETSEITENDVEQTSDVENVKIDVTTVSKRNDSYIKHENSAKLEDAKVALQAEPEQALPEAI